LAAAATLGGAAASAEGLGSLKADGIVGERADGYLGLVKSEVSPEVKQLVDSINARRKAEYQRIATNNQISLADVEVLAGRKAMEKTAPGEWIYEHSWRRK
jgi:uncharacterized protein YdbL (DUF1318 family)